MTNSKILPFPRSHSTVHRVSDKPPSPPAELDPLAQAKMIRHLATRIWLRDGQSSKEEADLLIRAAEKIIEALSQTRRW